MNLRRIKVCSKIKLDLIWFYQVVILLLPIVDNYQIIPIRVSQITYAFGVVLTLGLLYSNTIGIKCKHLIYALYVVVGFILLTYLHGLGSVSYIIPRIGTFLLLFLNYYILAYQIWDFKRCFQLYKRICIICSVVVILQFGCGILGKGFSVMIPGLKTNSDVSNTDMYIAEQIATNRFSSFFLEPAHQSEYCLPCIAILLFLKARNRRNNIIIALLITAGIMATTSLLGILGVGIVWFVFLSREIIKGHIRGIQSIIVLLPVAVVAVFVLMQQESIQAQFIKKISSVSNGAVVKDTSLYVRLFYGWDCYNDTNLLTKLFGYGVYNSKAYLTLSGIGMKYTTDPASIGYLNGMSEMFCELGLVGVLLCFSIIVFPVIKSHNITAKAILLCWLIIMLSSGSYGTPTSLIPVTMMLSFAYTLNDPEKMILQELKNE